MKRAERFSKAYKQEINTYLDFQEMLAAEAKNIEAVIVSTPDWFTANRCARAFAANYMSIARHQWQRRLKNRRRCVVWQRRAASCCRSDICVGRRQPTHWPLTCDTGHVGASDVCTSGKPQVHVANDHAQKTSQAGCTESVWL